jgi:hypothetical protein
MQYFVRTMEKHRDSKRVFSEEVLLCPGLGAAKLKAKVLVTEADPAIMLQADVCFKRGLDVRTKYRCWINERGEFQERSLI